VLVADVGDHVLSVNVVPELLGGDVGDFKGGVDERGSSVRVADSAWGTEFNLAAGKNGGAQKSGTSESFHG
jgi:hypothetical protein